MKKTLLLLSLAGLVLVPGCGGRKCCPERCKDECQEVYYEEAPCASRSMASKEVGWASEDFNDYKEETEAPRVLSYMDDDFFGSDEEPNEKELV